MKVRLTGKTKHGKNRVREHGEIWKVKSITEKVNFPRVIEGPGPFLFLIPSSGSDDMRWVSEVGDPNFEVEQVGD
jgi:hypothetical protein